MRRVLLIGENPNGPSGNGLMMEGVISQIDPSDTLVSVFCPCSDFSPDLTRLKNVQLVPSDDLKRGDLWGSQKLLNMLQMNELDFVVFIGIDVWRYMHIIPQIKQIQQRAKFKLIHIFPYDLHYLDQDFIRYANMMDIPCVYSEYGFDTIKPFVPNLRYFRPVMPLRELFFPYDEQSREEARQSLFPTLSPGTFVFGFIGPNQIRKDPQKVMKAFALLKKSSHLNTVLYMHTDFKEGVFNLQRYAMSLGLSSGDLLIKPEGAYSPFDRMPNIYNAFDCFVNCSLQEGLSWTTIQAMLCGVPVIVSDSTAHRELVHGYGRLVRCENETYIPIRTFNGSSWVDSKSCSSEDIHEKMKEVIVAPSANRELCRNRMDIIHGWMDGCSNFNDLIKIMPVEAAKPLLPAILFMQHSAAGDVLMTTRCLKRIRQKHKNMPLVYMTQEKFFGLLENNPDVSMVVPWNPESRNAYQVVYNPHGEHILRGGFNNLDVKLADMYPYFCKVEPDDFFIDLKKPDLDGPEYPWNNAIYQHYVVVHTTGGDPVYRTYPHMGLVIKGLNLPVVQIGSKEDLYVPGAIDLRGILSFTETAWVVKNATAAIVIDSFPSHLCGAVGTPTIVLYGPAPARVVGPVHPKVPDNLWFDMEPNKLEVCPNLTNCHGQNRNCQSPCISSINPFDIRDNLVKILSQVIPNG